MDGREDSAASGESGAVAEGLPHPYLAVGTLGDGGMGRVMLVHDVDLDRPAALKVLHARLVHDATARTRFEREARITAQLQHPGVPPVLRHGTLDDGRPYYVMGLVRGDSLAQQIGSRRPLRERVDLVARVAEIVAYAHDEGVLHRDIKPDNVMIGAFGEVVLVDWGIAVREGEADRPGMTLDQEFLSGTVVGTPAWMSPERIRGRAVGRPADVYALGALLYAALAGEPPVAPGAGLRAALRAPRNFRPPPGPADLVALTRAAMSEEPASRPTAHGFADGLRDWLGSAIQDGGGTGRSGSAMQGPAAEQRARAEEAFARAVALRDEADDQERQGRRRLDGVADWAPEAHKRHAWAMLDKADRSRADAARLEESAVQALHVALSLDPDDAAARALLVDHHRRRALDAVRVGDERALASHRTQLRAWSTGGDEELLARDVPVDLSVLPDGVRVLRSPLQRHLRRYRLGSPQEIGRTPIPDLRLPEGPCVLHLIPRDGEPARLAMRLTAGVPWPPEPPPRGERVAFLPRGSVGTDARYVPAGWLELGEDPLAVDPLPPCRVWVRGFVMERFPVTHRRYLAFLNDLVEQGRTPEAERHAPSLVSHGRGGRESLYAFDGTRYALDPSQHASPTPEHPATFVDWEGAAAFARWRAERTGLPWRLPHELEWLHAAGAGLGWAFPWGPVGDPAWSCMMSSHPKKPNAVAVSAFPVDESVFAIRQVAGNVRNWCLNTYSRAGYRSGGVLEVGQEGPDGLKVCRGGSWVSSQSLCRLTSRFAAPVGRKASVLGFRLVRAASDPTHTGRTSPAG